MSGRMMGFGAITPGFNQVANERDALLGAAFTVLDAWGKLSKDNPGTLYTAAKAIQALRIVVNNCEGAAKP